MRISPRDQVRNIVGMSISSIDDPKRSSPFPVEPRVVLVTYGKYLLEYEKSEILEYDTVYYLNVNGRGPS